MLLAILGFLMRCDQLTEVSQHLSLLAVGQLRAVSDRVRGAHPGPGSGPSGAIGFKGLAGAALPKPASGI